VIRIPIKRSPWWASLLVLFGATASRSYIQIDSDTITVRFGWYRIMVSRSEIESVNEDRWPWYGGLGWRTDFRRKLALVGAYSPVVRFHLHTPQRARVLGIPVRFEDLYVSVDSPEVLRSALST
jgi:hypothetical protein